jgi:hypothetical protein
MTRVRATLCALAILGAVACDVPQQQSPTAATGVRQATAQVQTQASGMTVEQENISERLKRDNQPGSVKHLYVISAYSGQVLIYSTVKGKVTSSGKRLTPTTVAANVSQYSGGIPFVLNGNHYYTGEVIQDDGTYGSSIPFLFWYDTKGVYHQHYENGGQIIHISDQPLRVPRVILNMETQTVAEEPAASADTTRRSR